MADDRRQIAEEIAAVLAEHRVRMTETADGGVRLSVTPHDQVATALRPLIDRVKAEAAADALEDAAATYDEAWPGIDPLTIDLRVRAAALRAAHTATDAQEATE